MLADGKPETTIGKLKSTLYILSLTFVISFRIIK